MRTVSLLTHDVVERGIPSLDEDEVLLNVSAALASSTHDYVAERFQLERGVTCSAVAGTIHQVGGSGSPLQSGDRVVAVVPATRRKCIVAEFAALPSYCVVKLPNTVSFACAVATLEAGIVALTALHYRCRLLPDSTILISPAATPRGLVLTQLAVARSCQVLAHINDETDARSLNALELGENVVQLKPGDFSSIAKEVSQNTGGLMCDTIILLNNTVEATLDAIHYLGVNGNLLTDTPGLQLDPEYCDLLMLKGASLSFVLPEMWLLSGQQTGRYRQMMREIVDQLASHRLTPPPYETATPEEVASRHDASHLVVVFD